MNQEGSIDFREIAARYTFQEHAERADRYFSGMNLDSAVARKPFASPLEVPDIVSGIAVVVAGLKLFHGAKVLDFGAGTCWFSRALAMMGCEVTAADVSAHALRIGRDLIERDPLGEHLRVSYAVLEGQRLPFPDESFDRITVFDAFHHSPNQMAMLAEFHRVLKQGGVIGFHEPGPNHSRMSQSQFEMRQYDVIEGDILIEDLFAEARRVGFTDARLALHLAYPAMLDLEQFNDFLAGRADMSAWLAEAIRRECDNRRVFFLSKGDAVPDSRSAVGLLADLQLSAELTDQGIVISGTAANTGAATWLPSSGHVGAVNVGVHMKAGGVSENDFARVSLSSVPVLAGQKCAVQGVIPLPDAEQFRLTLDLVAESVSWFEIGGTRPVVFDVDRAKGTIRTP